LEYGEHRQQRDRDFRFQRTIHPRLTCFDPKEILSMPDGLERYARHGHHQVEGWLLTGAIDLIRRLAEFQVAAGITGNIAEIGVHHGRLFILLALLARPGEKAVAIDLFENQELNIDKSGSGDLAHFRENVARYADPAAVIIHSGDSTRITGDDVIRMAGGPVRLFSVDGGHTASITCHDLETAEKALAPGGVIILDDCFNERWPDVSAGFHRFFSTTRTVVPFATGGNKTFLTFPDMAEAYRSAFGDCGSDRHVREFMGFPVACFEFDRPSLEVRIGQVPLWRVIRNVPGIPALRRFYRARRPFFSN
jgi:hypothetical protein